VYHRRAGAALTLHSAHHTPGAIHRSVRVTRAMTASVTDHVWSQEKLLGDQWQHRREEHAWHGLSTAVTVTGADFSVTASVSSHIASTDPSSGPISQPRPACPFFRTQ